MKAMRIVSSVLLFGGIVVPALAVLILIAWNVDESLRPWFIVCASVFAAGVAASVIAVLRRVRRKRPRWELRSDSMAEGVSVVLSRESESIAQALVKPRSNEGREPSGILLRDQTTGRQLMISRGEVRSVSLENVSIARMVFSGVRIAVRGERAFDLDLVPSEVPDSPPVTAQQLLSMLQ